MNYEKYIGMDVHQATISVAVMDVDRKIEFKLGGLTSIRVRRFDGRLRTYLTASVPIRLGNPDAGFLN